MRILSVVRSAAASINPTYVRTDLVQRTLLTLGSGVGSILDPSRDDLISAFGDLTSPVVLPALRRRMLADPEGAQILAERPVINTKTLDLDRLAALPENAFGRRYVEYMRGYDYTPDARRPVLFVEDEDLAYILLRYRQIHDFTHCLLGMKTNMLGEVTVKVFEAIQLNLPMCWLAGYFGVVRLGPKHTQAYLTRYLPWIVPNARNSRTLLNVYFEKHFEKDIDQLRSELNLTTLPPDVNDQK